MSFFKNAEASLQKFWLLLRRQETRRLGLVAAGLKRRNRTSKLPVTAPGGPVVSLTSYGQRIETVYLTLESIGAGTLKPSRLILWLQSAAAVDGRPDTLRRLEARGLEVRQCENYGPHSKYYPSLGVIDVQRQPLALADDDVLYPRPWLAQLWASYLADRGVMSCHRAHTMCLRDDAIAPYSQWPDCTSASPSRLHFATGASGTLLPPELLQNLQRAGTEFQALCPRADDVWLHLHAVRTGLRVRQVSVLQKNYPTIPGTQAVTLMSSNVHDLQNDAVIARCYTADDVALLAQAHGTAQTTGAPDTELLSCS